MTLAMLSGCFSLLMWAQDRPAAKPPAFKANNWPIALSGVAPAAAPESARGELEIHGVPIEEPAEGHEPAPLITDWDGSLPALPVKESAVILIGDVTSASAEIVNRVVRSQFTVQVESVLKKPDKKEIGSVVRVGRAGGRVQFPTGKTFLFTEYGKGSPEENKRYLFLLSPDGAPNGAWTIITAFCLEGDKAYSIDGKAAERPTRGH